MTTKLEKINALYKRQRGYMEKLKFSSPFSNPMTFYKLKEQISVIDSKLNKLK